MDFNSIALIMEGECVGTICRLFFSTFIAGLQSAVIDSTKASVFLLFVGFYLFIFSERCKPKSLLAKRLEN